MVLPLVQLRAKKKKLDRSRLEEGLGKARSPKPLTSNAFASLIEDNSPPRASPGGDSPASPQDEKENSADEEQLDQGSGHEEAEQGAGQSNSTSATKKKNKVKKPRASKGDDAPAGGVGGHSMEEFGCTWEELRGCTWEGQTAGVESWHVIVLTLLVLLLAHLTRDIVVYMHKGSLITLGGTGETMVRTVMGATGMVAINLSTVILFPRVSS